jgi:DNA-binding winged helix-turn-helix (wHTH) protein
VPTIQITGGGRTYDLDDSDGRLYHDHLEVRLTRRLWGLLLYLVKNHTRLIPKDELVRKVWERSALNDEAVAQAIRNLRQILGDESRAPSFIATEHGKGYRFIAKVAKISTLSSEARALADQLLNASADPHHVYYIAPMLLHARRLGEEIQASDRFFQAIDVLVGDIDEVRTALTIPEPAHISVNDLQTIVDELESYVSRGESPLTRQG